MYIYIVYTVHTYLFATMPVTYIVSNKNRDSTRVPIFVNGSSYGPNPFIHPFIPIYPSNYHALTDRLSLALPPHHNDNTACS